MILFMNILRKMLLVILAGLLPLFLWTLAIDVGILKTAGSSAPIKKILSDSGIYGSVVSGVLDQAKTSGGDQGGGVSLTDPAIKQAAENTFTPQFLQTNTEKVLDSIFVWLNGKTPIPDFKIDVTGLKSTFATEAGKAAQQRAATLPVCPSGLSGSADNFDAFSATCLPRGLTPALVATQVKNDINSGQGFIKDPVISADSIKGETDCPAGGQCTNKSVFENQYKNAPRAYQEIKKTPIVLGILALLTTLGIVFLSSSRAAGLRRAGIVFLIIGSLLLVFAWGLNWGINQKALPKMNLDNKVLQEKVKNLISDVVASVDKTFYIFGGAYAGLGLAAIGSSMFLGRRNGSKSNKVEDDLEGEGRTKEDRIDLKEPDKPTPLAKEPVAKPVAPKKKPPKIQ